MDRTILTSKDMQMILAGLRRLDSVSGSSYYGQLMEKNVFEKSKASALTSEAFTDFIKKNDIAEFYLIGADATGCVKSTSYNLVKAGNKVHVISDCVTSYDLKKMDEMLEYYANKGCEVLTLEECMMEKED